MKEFFKKIKNWANRNKGLAIIIALTIVLLLILLIIFLQMLIGGSSDKYGNRLDGIEQTPGKDYHYYKRLILGALITGFMSAVIGIIL